MNKEKPSFVNKILEFFDFLDLFQDSKYYNYGKSSDQIISKSFDITGQALFIGIREYEQREKIKRELEQSSIDDAEFECIYSFDHDSSKATSRPPTIT